MAGEFSTTLAKEKPGRAGLGKVRIYSPRCFSECRNTHCERLFKSCKEQKQLPGCPPSRAHSPGRRQSDSGGVIGKQCDQPVPLRRSLMGGLTWAEAALGSSHRHRPISQTLGRLGLED